MNALLRCRSPNILTTQRILDANKDFRPNPGIWNNSACAEATAGPLHEARSGCWLLQAKSRGLKRLKTHHRSKSCLLCCWTGLNQTSLSSNQWHGTVSEFNNLNARIFAERWRQPLVESYGSCFLFAVTFQTLLQTVVTLQTLLQTVCTTLSGAMSLKIQDLDENPYLRRKLTIWRGFVRKLGDRHLKRAVT